MGLGFFQQVSEALYRLIEDALNGEDTESVSLPPEFRGVDNVYQPNSNISRLAGVTMEPAPGASRIGPMPEVPQQTKGEELDWLLNQTLDPGSRVSQTMPLVPGLGVPFDLTHLASPQSSGWDRAAAAGGLALAAIPPGRRAFQGLIRMLEAASKSKNPRAALNSVRRRVADDLAAGRISQEEAEGLAAYEETLGFDSPPPKGRSASQPGVTAPRLPASGSGAGNKGRVARVPKRAPILTKDNLRDKLKKVLNKKNFSLDDAQELQGDIMRATRGTAKELPTLERKEADKALSLINKKLSKMRESPRGRLDYLRQEAPERYGNMSEHTDELIGPEPESTFGNPGVTRGDPRRDAQVLGSIGGRRVDTVRGRNRAPGGAIRSEDGRMIYRLGEGDTYVDAARTRRNPGQGSGELGKNPFGEAAGSLPGEPPKDEDILEVLHELMGLGDSQEARYLRALETILEARSDLTLREIIDQAVETEFMSVQKK